MTQQALRELVAKWRAEAELHPLKTLAPSGVCPELALEKCADDLEALLGEQREAQGAVFTDNGDEIEARLKYDAEHSCPACGGSGHKDDVAPPLAESVASQRGEPFGWLRANGHFERGAELISKHPQDAEGAIPLYSAPAAGMDADKAALEILRFLAEWNEEHWTSEEIAAIIRRHMQQGK